MFQILESKIGNFFKQFFYLQNSLSIFFSEDSKVFCHFLLINSYSKNLAKYVSAYVKGKKHKIHSHCNLIENEKGQGHNRLSSRFLLLHAHKHTFVDAFGLIKYNHMASIL